MRYEKLGYIALNVSNLERSREFYLRIVGLMESPAGDPDRVFLRCSHDHHNIVLQQGAEPGFKRVGIEMQDEQAVDELAAKLRRHDVRVLEVPADECAALHQQRSIRFTEPCSGATWECYASMNRWGGQPFVPTHTKIQRLGHAVIASPRFDEAVRFHTEVLELKVSDMIGSAVCFMRFHPNPFHHGWGIGAAKAPKLHHVNFMVTEVDDIGKAIARFAKNGVTIVNGPGRHPASGSMFLYFLDPDGLTLEYSFGMEEFPPEGARKPRVFEPVRASFDYWDSFLDAERKSAIGAIEPL